MVVIRSFSGSVVDSGTNDAVFAVMVFGLCLTVVGQGHSRIHIRECKRIVFGNMTLFSGDIF